MVSADRFDGILKKHCFMLNQYFKQSLVILIKQNQCNFCAKIGLKYCQKYIKRQFYENVQQLL